MGSAPLGKVVSKRRAVDEENVEPAVVIVIDKGDAAAGGFEQIFIALLRRRRWFSR